MGKKPTTDEPGHSREVTFARDFDYRHRSGAETAFKAGFTGRVRGHIANAAATAGALVDEINTTPAADPAAAIEG